MWATCGTAFRTPAFWKTRMYPPVPLAYAAPSLHAGPQKTTCRPTPLLPTTYTHPPHRPDSAYTKDRHTTPVYTYVYTTIGGCTLIYKPPKSQCWLGPQTKGHAPKPKQSHSTPFEPSFTLQARVANAKNDSRVERNGRGHKSSQTAPRTAAGKYSRASS